eukprot:11138699-Alexandrium_andersonii.AAC.1
MGYVPPRGPPRVRSRRREEDAHRRRPFRVGNHLGQVPGEAALVYRHGPIELPPDTPGRYAGR